MLMEIYYIWIVDVKSVTIRRKIQIHKNLQNENSTFYQ